MPARLINLSGNNAVNLNQFQEVEQELYRLQVYLTLLLKQSLTTVSQHLKCLKFERLRQSDFEDTLVTRLYFRGVWTVYSVNKIMLPKF